ncbi:hypothetical protein B0H13DRAFT_2660198 [Mycena leptocephala]|nr:hypothetical protein B0H13DRAFT_2660198 [Mycena leptocephala]
MSSCQLAANPPAGHRSDPLRLESSLQTVTGLRSTRPTSLIQPAHLARPPLLLSASNTRLPTVPARPYASRRRRRARDAFVCAAPLAAPAKPLHHRSATRALPCDYHALSTIRVRDYDVDSRALDVLRNCSDVQVAALPAIAFPPSATPTPSTPCLRTHKARCASSTTRAASTSASLVAHILSVTSSRRRNLLTRRRPPLARHPQAWHPLMDPRS